MDQNIKRLLEAYPEIFLACHRRHTRETDDGSGITEHQAGILDHVHAGRATTHSKLAEHFGSSRSTMSITVARLVRKGYIARATDTTDARRVGLTRTPAGERIKERERSLAGIECLAKYARILLRQRKRGRKG